MVNLKNIYLEEAEDLFKLMEQALLMLENSPEDASLIAEVFRSMHTLKGSSSMYGSTRVADFIHNLETVYDRVRSGSMPLTTYVIECTFRSLDHLRNIVQDPEITDPIDKENHEKLTAEIVRILDTASDSTQGSVVQESVKEKELTTYLIHFEPHPDVFLDGTNPMLLVDELADLGKSKVYAYMDLKSMGKEFNHEKCFTSWDVVLSTEHGESPIKDVFIFVEDTSKIKVEQIAKSDLMGEQAFVDGLPESKLDAAPLTSKRLKSLAARVKTEEPGTSKDVKVEKASPAPKKTEEKAPQASEPQKGGRSSHELSKSISSIRVPSEKLDELMNQVSELVTTQASLSLYSQNHFDPALEIISENVEKLSRQLRDIAFGMTLIEINTLFVRFQRFVRDISSQMDKSVDFITEGGDTELDKKIIESLTDPLMHLIRNSLDHGLETREERVAKGKDRKGMIMLKAYYSGAKVYIQIKDDGRGLDTEKIRKKAIEKGLITADDKLSEKETFDLIFQPGFSTAQNVSDLSGRGVGMDVVKKNIMEIRGDISVESQKDMGTTITLGLPLTLSVIDGLLVKIQQTNFVIPLGVVKKCHEVPTDQLTNDFNQLIVLDEEQIAFVDLRKEFDMQDENTPSKSSVVIIQNDNTRIGVCVDSIVGEYQAVLKPVGKYYRNQEFVSGATILGDGTIALVLDTYKIIAQKISKNKLMTS